MTLATAKVATSTLLFLLNRLLNLRSIGLSLLRRWPLFNSWLSTRLNKRPLPKLLLTKRLLLHWARSNMMPFNLALESNNLGWILDFVLALLLLLLLLVSLGLVIDI